jgi:hypothetical protein
LHGLLDRSASGFMGRYGRRRDVSDWPVASDFSLGPDVSLRGEAEAGRAADFAASVEKDAKETLGV